MFVKCHSESLVRHERVRFKHMRKQSYNNVSIEVKNIFALTKKLENMLSEIKVYMF